MRPALELRLPNMSGLRRTEMIGVAWKERLATLAQESGRAYLVALRTVGTPVLAEEAVQEAFAKLAQRPIEDRGVAETQIYFLKMVRGVALDILRSERGRKRREVENNMGAIDPVPSTERTVLDKEMVHAVRSAISELPIEEREAISLCYEQDLSQQHAGEILGIPQQTVSTRIRRGMERLRLRLAGQGFAALTPMAIAGGLRDLGVPPAPAKLLDAIQSIAHSTRASVRMARKAAGSRAAGSVRLQVAYGVVLAVAVGAAAWMLGSPKAAEPQPVPEPSLPVMPAKPAATTPAKAVVPAAEEDAVFLRWNFENGPAQDLKDVEGSWQWMRNDEKTPGFMGTGPNQWARVVLPVRIPKKPMLLTVKLLCRLRPSTGYWWDHGWWDGKSLLKKKIRFDRGGKGGLMAKHVQCFYFIDRYTFVVLDQSLSRIYEYDKPSPAERIRICVYNFDIQEIELRSLRSEEVPERFRDPENRIIEMNSRKAAGEDLSRTFEFPLPAPSEVPSAKAQTQETNP